MSNVHRFFGGALPNLPGTPARDLTPDEHAAAIAVHGAGAVALRWTHLAHEAPVTEAGTPRPTPTATPAPEES